MSGTERDDAAGTPAPDRRRAAGGLTVAGTGHAAVAVDQVRIRLAVEVTRPDPGDAFRDGSAVVTAVLAAIADGGVDSRHVRTTDLRFGPHLEHDAGGQRVVGYQCGQQLLVLLPDLSRLEQLLSNVVQRGGGAVRIDGVELAVADSEPARRQARVAAFADARAAAGQLAELAGRPLGRVRWIDEGGRSGGSRPVLFAAAARPAMPVATGDLTVTVELTVRFDFAG